MAYPIGLKPPTKERIDKEFETLAPKVNVFISALNTMAGRELYDAVALLRKSKYYRHTVKVDIEKAYAEYERYEEFYKKKLGEERFRFYLNYLDSVEEITEEYTKAMYERLREIMRLNGEDEYEMKSKCEMAYILTTFSCDTFDGLMRTSRGHVGVDFTRSFKDTRLTKMRNHIKRVCNVVCRGKQRVVSLNDDEQFQKACVALYDLLCEEDTLERASHMAVNVDRELSMKLSEKAKEILNE